MIRKIFRGFRKVFAPSLCCSFFPSQIAILSDGSVTTCCYDVFGKNRFASVYGESIDKIWAGPVRGIVSGGLDSLPYCRNCIGTPRARLLSDKKLRNEWRKITNGPLRRLVVEITAQCNYNCCASNELHKFRKSTKPDLDKIFENIKSALPKIQKLILFNCGEPLLHEGLCDFIKKCRAASDSVDMLLSTNGMLLTEAISHLLIEQRLDKIVISIHGGPGTENMLKYSRTGADYKIVLENVRRLAKLRKAMQAARPVIEIKTVLFNWNDTDELMDALRRDVMAAGADTLYWVLDWETGQYEYSSKRFTPGSAALEQLRHRGEFGSG